MLSFIFIGRLVPEEKILKVLTIYEHSGYLSHVTWIIYFNFRSLFTRGPHIKLALIGQAVSEKMFKNNSHVHVYSPMAEADSTLGSKSFQNHNFF